MYELIQAVGSSYYIQCPAKIGLVRLNETEVCLIDGGSDKDTGRKVRQILDKNGWKLTAIFNTHFHADHIGGNQYLQAQTGCKIYLPGADSCVAAYPVLEPISLYGGFPPKDLRNKFLMAKESKAEVLTPNVLPEGMTVIDLPGHSFEMVGFRTADDVVYLADSLCSEETLKKYQITFLYDVAAYLETLEQMKTMEAALFVPAHATPAEEIALLVQKNIDKVWEIAEKILEICREPHTFEDLLQRLFLDYDLRMNFDQYVLVGSTVRSYLAWLRDSGKLEILFENAKMLWKA